jgi:hypothetical protein
MNGSIYGGGVVMNRHLFVPSCVFLFLMGLLSGCKTQQATSLVNTVTFETGELKSLRLDFDADDIHVLRRDRGKVILKEYMNQDKRSYYAKTSTQNGQLLITEGTRPKRSSFESYIEIYIPPDYTNSLSLHSTSGAIYSEFPLNLAGDFRVDTTSGKVEVSNMKAAKLWAASTNGSLAFQNIAANEIHIQTTNATTSMNEMNGSIDYQTKGGKLTASELYGSGTFHASGEGSLHMSFSAVKDNISAYSKNGILEVTLPNELAFTFSSKTKKGSIAASFADRLDVTDKTATGTIGASPEIAIELETENGDIKVSR